LPPGPSPGQPARLARGAGEGACEAGLERGERMSSMTDPITRFEELFERAKREEPFDATAMALATVSRDGAPAVRMVLLKAISAAGFVFSTNYESRKGIDIEGNAFGALCFFWPKMYVQVRVEGPISQTTSSESDELFTRRPRGHQLGAWSSNQSRPIESAESLARQFAATEERFGADRPVPRPPHWGGYRITPLRIEFWFGRENRMHDRELFTREDSSRPWTLSRLQP
jgi:pyridoxamine 5'-phosphate oxidase